MREVGFWRLGIYVLPLQPPRFTLSLPRSFLFLIYSVPLRRQLLHILILTAAVTVSVRQCAMHQCVASSFSILHAHHWELHAQGSIVITFFCVPLRPYPGSSVRLTVDEFLEVVKAPGRLDDMRHW